MTQCVVVCSCNWEIFPSNLCATSEALSRAYMATSTVLQLKQPEEACWALTPAQNATSMQHLSTLVIRFVKKIDSCGGQPTGSTHFRYFCYFWAQKNPKKQKSNRGIKREAGRKTSSRCRVEGVISLTRAGKQLQNGLMFSL